MNVKIKYIGSHFTVFTYISDKKFAESRDKLCIRHHCLQELSFVVTLAKSVLIYNW